MCINSTQCSKKFSFTHVIVFAQQFFALFSLHTVEGTLGGPDKVTGAHGTLLVLVRVAPEGLSLCHFRVMQGLGSL